MARGGMFCCYLITGDHIKERIGKGTGEFAGWLNPTSMTEAIKTPIKSMTEVTQYNPTQKQEIRASETSTNCLSVEKCLRRTRVRSLNFLIMKMNVL